jgi:hypothetical protein
MIYQLKRSRPNVGTIPEFSWKGWGKSRRTTFRIAGVPADILTEQQRNVCREIYRYAYPLGLKEILQPLVGLMNQGLYELRIGSAGYEDWSRKAVSRDARMILLLLIETG